MVEACIDGMMEEPVYDRLHTIQQQVLVIYGVTRRADTQQADTPYHYQGNGGGSRG